MPFKVLLHPKAANLLKKLDPTVQEGLKKRMQRLKTEPTEAGEKYKYSDFWKLRGGKYRAIYEIDHEKKQVTVLFIGPRDKVHDDFAKLF